MPTDTASLQTVLDVVGVFVFALSGALVAARHPDARRHRISLGVRLLDAAGLGLFAVSGP
ncbi:MAG TPA: hypothetical protein VLQ78_13865 [Ornithinibacter sp.]|nr:hypothetical protein [Ornithinibacter sp.]